MWEEYWEWNTFPDPLSRSTGGCKINTKKSGSQENEVEGGPKKGWENYISGMDQSKLIGAIQLLVDNNLVEHLKKLSSSEAKEDIFDYNWDAVQKLSLSSVNMYKPIILSTSVKSEINMHGDQIYYWW